MAYIGLGSNLEQPVEQVTGAINELAALSRSRLVMASSLYRSAPLGPQDQPDFINAVVKLETGLAAPDLLNALKQIEDRHGRTRTRHWGPRTLDLDLLVYGSMIINTEDLTIPHPQLAQRSFVLEPLLEIEPDIDIPGLGPGVDLYRKLSPGSLQKVVPA